MKLPGGLWNGETRHRDFTFEPMTGRTELAIAEAVMATVSVPERVSRVLAATVATLGGRPASVAQVERLSVADRQYLMRRLAALLGHDEVWLSSDCHSCGERFEIHVRQSEMPVREAADSYPFVQIESAEGRCRLRIPNGRDQAVAALHSEDDEALWTLAERCFIDGEGEWSEPPRTGAWRQAVDEALDREAPQVALTATTRCPGCGADNEVGVDPYLSLRGSFQKIFTDVHALASRYHWAEEEILDLPRQRRQIYLELLDRETGPTH